MATFIDMLRNNMQNAATTVRSGAVAPTGYNPSQYVISPSMSSNPDSANAYLTRQQYQYFLNRGKPQETLALNDINDPATSRKVAATAGLNAGAMVDATRGMEERNLGRFGVPITADKKRSLDRNFGLERALAVSGATNNAFGATEDVQTDLAGDALNIGREVSGQASQGLSSAASLATERARARAAGNSANKQSTISSIGTGAGLGAAVGLSAGIGSLAAGSLGAAAAGGGIGAGIGLLAAFL